MQAGAASRDTVNPATGEQIEGQVWDDDRLFSTGCCGDDHNLAYRSNGAVVTVHDRTVKIFVPSGTNLEPQTVETGGVGASGARASTCCAASAARAST